MKKYWKIIVDVLMFLLFLYLMSYHAGRGLLLHALLGITLFVLFIIHHLLNLYWYRTLFRGEYGFRRILLTASNILLLAAMLFMMLSAFMLSGMVFSFSTIPVDFGWIEIHYFSTAWGFMLMAFHLGLHLHSAFNKLEVKLKETSFEYVLWLLEVILFLAGAYGFVQSGLWSDMVLSAQSITPMTPVVFYIVHIGIVTAVCLAAHWIILVLSRRRKKGAEIK
ncbi:hypothetical protein [Lacrimispora brassicae]